MSNTQQRFETVLSERLRDFENEKDDNNRRGKAVLLINVFRALLKGPLIPNLDVVRYEYQSVIEKIAALNLPWSDLDSFKVPSEHSADVQKLQDVLFEPETQKINALPKSVSVFGELDIDSLQRSYGEK